MRNVLLALSASAFLTSCFKEDKVAPVVKLKDPTTMEMWFNGYYFEPGYTARDNRDGDITEFVEVTGTINKEYAGINYLYYSVTDASGNKSPAQTRFVRVKHHAGSLSGIYVSTESCLAPGNNHFSIIEQISQTGIVIDHLISNDTISFTGFIGGTYGMNLSLNPKNAGDTTYTGSGIANPEGSSIEFTILKSYDTITDTCIITLNR